MASVEKPGMRSLIDPVLGVGSGGFPFIGPAETVKARRALTLRFASNLKCNPRAVGRGGDGNLFCDFGLSAPTPSSGYSAASRSDTPAKCGRGSSRGRRRRGHGPE